MTVAGLLLAAIGGLLTFDVLESTERLARFSRPFPWWMKGIGADYPITYRIIGVLVGVTGLGLIIGGVATGQVMP